MGARNTTPQTAHIINPVRAATAIHVTPEVITRLEAAKQHIAEVAIPKPTKNEEIHCARCCTCGFFKGKDKEASLLAMKSNELQESQYVKTLEKLEAMLGKQIRFAEKHKENLQKLEHKLVKCYADNPNKPLVCSDAAKEYQNFIFKQQLDAILCAEHMKTQK